MRMGSFQMLYTYIIFNIGDKYLGDHYASIYERNGSAIWCVLQYGASVLFNCAQKLSNEFYYYLLVERSSNLPNNLNDDMQM